MSRIGATSPAGRVSVPSAVTWCTEANRVASVAPCAVTSSLTVEDPATSRLLGSGSDEKLGHLARKRAQARSTRERGRGTKQAAEAREGADCGGTSPGGRVDGLGITSERHLPVRPVVKPRSTLRLWDTARPVAEEIPEPGTVTSKEVSTCPRLSRTGSNQACRWLTRSAVTVSPSCPPERQITLTGVPFAAIPLALASACPRGRASPAHPG